MKENYNSIKLKKYQKQNCMQEERLCVEFQRIDNELVE